MAAVDCYQNQAQAEGTGQQTPTHQQSSHQQHHQHQHQQQQQSQSQPQLQQATAGIPGKDDERKLFVGGLSRNTTDKELRDHFGKFGEIESISVKIDPYTGMSRGFAFMVFTNPKTIDKLLASGEHYINKRKVGSTLGNMSDSRVYPQTFRPTASPLFIRICVSSKVSSRFYRRWIRNG